MLARILLKTTAGNSLVKIFEENRKTPFGTIGSWAGKFHG